MYLHNITLSYSRTLAVERPKRLLSSFCLLFDICGAAGSLETRLKWREQQIQAPNYRLCQWHNHLSSFNDFFQPPHLTYLLPTRQTRIICSRTLLCLVWHRGPLCTEKRAIFERFGSNISIKVFPIRRVL